jgi:hypothetical protein
MNEEQRLVQKRFGITEAARVGTRSRAPVIAPYCTAGGVPEDIIQLVTGRTDRVCHAYIRLVAVASGTLVIVNGLPLGLTVVFFD